MCGIAGIVGQPSRLDAVRRMIDTLGHRGPDGHGTLAEDGVILGHARLAILDLSPAGAQPMTSLDGRWSIVFNGEIFNYLEIRTQLGAQVRTATDTEVLLEACAEWGVEAAIGRAVGMFAFALWDAREMELTLVRDRVGEKPLTYFEDGGWLAFASELKALAPLHAGTLDPRAVDAYLALGYVPAPLAIFRGCRKLPAGHLLRWKDGRSSVRRWWFPETARPEVAARFEDRTLQLRAALSIAVRLRLRSDVPVALSLSGGLDSSVLAAELSRQNAAATAFTVVLDGDEGELPYARSVAARFHLRHEIVRANAGDAPRQLERMAAHYDEPFADSSALPSLALAAAVRSSYKVILNGDGGDEAFAGYWHYEFIGAKQALKAAAAAAGLCDGQGAAGVYVQSKVHFREKRRARLMGSRASNGSLGRLLDADEFLRLGAPNALKRALWSDRHLYLANDLTYKTDVALGAFGIEGRAPFLDHRILEWAQALPASDLVRGRRKKVILRQAYAGELPPEVAARPKRGFGAPIEKWLTGPLAELVGAVVPCPLLDPDAQRDHTGQRLWALLVFACWARRWRASW